MALASSSVPALTLGGAALPLVSPARVYVCGITPYDVTHLGHAATFVWADAAARILRMTGVAAQTCRNVTDVDDVLTQVAADRGSGYDELAVTQEYLFEQDMAALGVQRPTHTPRAHRYVDRVIELVGALLVTGHAYERDGQVFFRGFPAIPGGAAAGAEEHGELIDAAAPGEPYDVAVWRRSGPGEPAWPSPWGRERPGWHAECAAMALSVLGPSVDLLVGGADLSFPHHAYQAALVEAVTGVRPFARARMPVGTVEVAGQKMAKSTGNLVLVSELLRKHSSAAIRLLLLDRDWRESWDFHEADLAHAQDKLERLYSAAARRSTSADEAVTEARDALLRELDVPAALAVAERAGGPAARLVLQVLALA